MPIYEFECAACGARFERLNDAGTEAASCLECGAEGASRVMSSFSATHRQPTASQRRRMEDARGTTRDGARTRWKQSMARARDRGKPGKGPPGGSG